MDLLFGFLMLLIYLPCCVIMFFILAVGIGFAYPHEKMPLRCYISWLVGTVLGPVTAIVMLVGFNLPGRAKDRFETWTNRVMLGI